MTERSCLACGFPLDPGQDHCPKCDSSQRAQRRELRLDRDIAHGGQTVAEALAACTAQITSAERAGYGQVRLVLGGGRIRLAVIDRLDWLVRQGRIRRWRQDGRNTGAVLVDLPPAAG